MKRVRRRIVLSRRMLTRVRVSIVGEILIPSQCIYRFQMRSRYARTTFPLDHLCFCSCAQLQKWDSRGGFATPLIPSSESV